MRRLLLRHSFDVFELFGALVAVCWGLLFLVGGPVERLSSYWVLRVLVQGNEPLIGAFFLIKGSAHIWGLLAGRYRESLAYLAAVVWTFVAIALWGAIGLATGTACYSLIALFSVLSSLRQRLLKRRGGPDE